MLKNILFIKALLANHDRLEQLLGDGWARVRDELLRLLTELIDEPDAPKLAARTHRLYRALQNTPAEPLVRHLFREAGETSEMLTHGLFDRMERDFPDLEERIGAPTKPDEEVSDRFGPKELKIAASELARAIASALESALPEQQPLGERTVTTHPNLGGDDHAYVAKPYKFAVKLSDQPQAAGAYLSVPPLDVPVKDGEVVKKIEVWLTAPDFDLDSAEEAQGWVREINFYPETAASSAATYTLHAQDRFEDRYFSTLRIQFVLNGQALGYADRRVEVLCNDSVIATPPSGFPPAPGYPLDERGEARVPPIPTPVRMVSDLPNVPGVHLTIQISEADAGKPLLWEIVSPYLKPNDFPEGDYHSPNLGAQEFVKEYLAPFGMPGDWPEDHMDTKGRLKPLSINILFNNLLTLRRKPPAEFWTLYNLALERHCAQGGAPQDFAILFITADTHVPWELMPVSEEVIGEKMPPLLGSTHCIGRWLLEVGTATPDSILDLHGFSVSAPTYATATLPEAQKERQFIQDHYEPHVLPDSADAFIAFMRTGAPTNGTGILHFAGHGDCCTDKMRRNWLVLTERQALYDINSASTDLGNRIGRLGPVLAFFNACNVGRAAPGPLGSNGGWGRALLGQQYKGYIGPLWSVYDKHARDICERFYELALDEHVPLGEVMRRIRARFTEDNQLFTYLAYLYLGHPLATIRYTPFEELPR